MAEKRKPIIILGGGAAGIFAAIGAAEQGVPATIIEKNNRLGIKLLITGKGRSNLTNTASLEHLIQQFPDHGSFLYGAFSSLSNNDLMNFFDQLGVPLKEERGGRVFPLSDRSKDVVEALSNHLNKIGVEIKLQTTAEGLVSQGDSILGVKLNGFSSPFLGGAVVLATGGLSYPRTGSTGEGYGFAKKIGHTITPLRPSLVPLEIKESWVPELSGLALKNVLVTAWGRKKIGEQFGEMLFTHFGVSGPIILTLSRNIVKELELGPIRLTINLKPALDRETLDKRLIRDFEKFSTKHLKNALVELLPQALITPVLKISNLDADKPTHQVTRAERHRLLDTLQALPLSVTKARPMAEAIVTSGGVSLKEVNPKTMASKIIPNLFFGGEVLDIDGFTGGYNLQAAFSTGYLAGQSAAVLLQS